MRQNYYRPQTKFAKVMFLQVSVCPRGGSMRGCSEGACVVAGGACVVAPGGCAWLLQGGMHGCSRGACMVALGACMVAPGGGMCGCSGGACMVAPGGVHRCSGEGCAWDMTRYGDTVNERAVRILLECILV